MTLAQALREAQTIRGWDWSRCRTRRGPMGWSYPKVLGEHVHEDALVLDVGTGGGEVFSAIARPWDVAVDLSLDMLAIARRTLPCSVVAASTAQLPFPGASFDVVAARHVEISPQEALRVLRPRGVFVSQQVGGKNTQSIFDAFGWGSNGEFWRREAAVAGKRHWDSAAMQTQFLDAGCELIRCEQTNVEHEFLDEASLAFWLLNAPLPEKVDPDTHEAVLNALPLRTNAHRELLVVRLA